MQRSRTYLDYNATAPLRPEVRAAVAGQLDRAGNPSSVHAEGRAARAMLEEARLSVARAFGTEPKCVTFSSLRGLPLTFPGTTGAPRALTGGKLASPSGQRRPAVA